MNFGIRLGLCTKRDAKIYLGDIIFSMALQFLSRYFPSPKYLKPHHLGLSFSDTNIKVFSFDRHNPESSLQSAILPLQEGTIVGGKIVNVEQVSEALKTLKKDFDSPFVFFTLPDELAYVFSASVPVVKSTDLTEAVAFTIEENVPLSLKEALFDFVPTEIHETDSGYVASLIVAACVRAEVEQFLKAIHGGGLEPIGCVHESQAIARALVSPEAPDVLCIVHATENRIGIYLVRGGLVHFVTISNVVSGSFEKQFLDEYEKFLEFSVKPGVKEEDFVKEVLVCGEFDWARRIVESVFRSKNLSKKIKLSNVWANIIDIEEQTPNIDFKDSINFAGPIGAALVDIT